MNEPQPTQPKREDELGAAWLKRSEKGDYMTGSVTIDGVKTDIVMFPNQYKSKDNQPDWRILKSRERGEKHTHAPSTRRDEQRQTTPHVLSPRPAEGWPPAGQQRLVKAAPARDWTDDVPPVITDEDIGF